MLELRNIDAGYNRRLVLKDVSVKIDTSAATVIMGPNGAGKSTLLKVMYGLIRPVSGGIYFNDVEIRPQPAELVKKGVFMIPQGKRAAHFWPKRFAFHNRLEEILIHFPDLKPRLDDLAGNLSGGQQQMVAIARGLINQPRLLLLDEPSIGLSPKLTADMFNKIKELNTGLGTGFVIVEHNLKTLLPLTDYAYILDQGQVVYEGTSRSKALDKMTASIFEKKVTCA